MADVELDGLWDCNKLQGQKESKPQKQIARAKRKQASENMQTKGKHKTSMKLRAMSFRTEYMVI